jgi:hypothetical protein
MVDPRLAPEVTLWTDAGGAAQAGHILDLMGSSVRPIGIGGPRVTEIDRLAEQLDCPRYDDLRQMLIDWPATFLLLAGREPVQRADLSPAARHDTLVLSLEPLDEQFASDQGPGIAASKPPSRQTPGPTDDGPITLYAPQFTRGPGWISAADPTEAIGPAQAVHLLSFGAADQCSLFARLFDAWYTLLAVAPMPDTIDASLTGPLTDAPENLRGLTGHLSAHARLPRRASAVIQVSDQAGRHERTLHAVGERGIVRIGDLRYELTDPSGRTIDQGGQPNASGTFADLVVDQWRRTLDRMDAVEDVDPKLAAQALACCQASLLSCRTGQAESPGKLLALRT